MKIALLNPPGKELFIRDRYCSSTSKANYYWQPVDLTVLSGIVSAEHRIQVIDAIAGCLPNEKVLSQLVQGGFQVVISLVGSASREEDFDFLKSVKEKTNATVIINGDFVTYDYQEVFAEYDFVDAVLLDFTSLRILDYLNVAGMDFDSPIDTIVYRSKGNTVIEGRWLKPSSFEIPIPRHELFPLTCYRPPYSKHIPFVTTLTSLGCPFQCVFCRAATLGYRYRPVVNVEQEFEYVVSLGIKEVFFKDAVIEVHKNNLKELCNVLKRLRLNWSCNARVDTLNEDLLKLMKQSGCYFISFGIESGEQGILDLYKKNITPLQALKTIGLCRL